MFFSPFCSLISVKKYPDIFACTGHFCYDFYYDFCCVKRIFAIPKRTSLIRLKEFHNVFHIFTFRACRLLCCFSDCNHCNYGLCFRNGKDLTELISCTESHDHSSITKLPCFKNQVLILKSQIIAAPAISKFIIRCTVFLETGTVLYKSSNDQSRILCLGLVPEGILC